MKKSTEFWLSLNKRIEFGRISTKDTYNITPAAKDMLKDSHPVFKDFLKKTTKLPITVDKPASNVMEKAKRKEFSKILIFRFKAKLVRFHKFCFNSVHNNTYCIINTKLSHYVFSMCIYCVVTDI